MTGGTSVCATLPHDVHSVCAAADAAAQDIYQYSVLLSAARHKPSHWKVALNAHKAHLLSYAGFNGSALAPVVATATSFGHSSRHRPCHSPDCP